MSHERQGRTLGKIGPPPRCWYLVPFVFEGTCRLQLAALIHRGSSNLLVAKPNRLRAYNFHFSHRFFFQSLRVHRASIRHLAPWPQKTTYFLCKYDIVEVLPSYSWLDRHEGANRASRAEFVSGLFVQHTKYLDQVCRIIFSRSCSKQILPNI